jgi:ABC-type Fe3+ transport system substrate-binding protein
MVYPRLDRDLPPVWIPCTVALVNGAPHRAAAEKLVDFLVSAEVEQRLAASDSRNVPVRTGLQPTTGPAAGHAPAPLDWGMIADAVEPAMEAAREILLR